MKSRRVFTFSVIYDDNCAPRQKPLVSYLWVDLDGDGEVEEAKTLVWIVPSNIRTPLLFTIVLAVFAVVICFFRSRLGISRLRLVFVAVLAGATLALVSCPASPEDEPPEDEKEKYTVQEVYDLVWINSDELDDWDNGEDFAVEVEIDAPPGEYTFLFYFEDDAGRNGMEGDASGELMLTIEES